MALVLETSKFSGNYILGFRVEKEEQVFDEIASLFNSYKSKPIFGIQCQFDDANVDIKTVTIPIKEDKMEIIETGDENVRSIQNNKKYGITGS